MRIVTVILLVGVMVLGLVAGPALGQVCDNNFTGFVDLAWQTPGNWDLGTVPNATEVACIPPDKECVILLQSPGYVEAKAIVLQRDQEDPPNRAELEVALGAQLIIYEDSTVDGVLTLKALSMLRIANSLTITGDGGRIQGVPVEGNVFATIDHADGADLAILTIASATPGASRETSLVVHGPMFIAVELRNSAYVVADFKTLLLELHKKWGSLEGHWIAENGGGMDVWVEVVGLAEWLIHEGDGSTIRIFADCPLLTGDVVIVEGVLHAQEDFLTTGNASIKSIDIGGEVFTTPEVWVEANATVRFGS